MADPKKKIYIFVTDKDITNQIESDEEIYISKELDDQTFILSEDGLNILTNEEKNMYIVVEN